MNNSIVKEIRKLKKQIVDTIITDTDNDIQYIHRVIPMIPGSNERPRCEFYKVENGITTQIERIPEHINKLPPIVILPPMIEKVD